MTLADEPLRWHRLLEVVRAEYPDLYRGWFQDLVPGRLKGGELQVRAPLAAQVSYLRQHCTQPFIQAAISLTGRLVSVHFVPAHDDRQSATVHGSPASITKATLSPDYTFDEFVVGPSNRLAHAACRAVCTQPGLLYNPLFIHGPSGLGKTHLLQAICADLAQAHPPLNVLYVSCDTFINDFVRAIESGQLQLFRKAARQADVLAVDDVQFLANRESSQEEFFHTFNVLHQNRRQLILSADALPSQIPTLEDRLASRFSWGLLAQIDLPSRETRHAILHKKVRLRGSEVPDDVLDFIAERVHSNIRLLEGALTKVLSDAQIAGKPITLRSAAEALNGFEGQLARPVQVSDILDATSRHFGIRLSDLLGRKRSRSVAHPRQVAMYLARKLTALSLEDIGGQFGGRDHSTVLHAERAIALKQQRDKATADTLSQLTRKLLSRP